MSMSISATATPFTKAAGISPAQPSSQSAQAGSTREQATLQRNSEIIKASIEVSITSKNEPLALLLKSAITGINEILEPEFGPDALQNAVNQDNTPEGTAGRIVALSTGFFQAYKDQNPNKPEADVLKDFMATIRRGFEQGFKEATDILESMGVFNGDIASNIEKTYALVLQGYEDFEAAQSGSKVDVPVADTVI